jgi:Tudor domain
MTNSDIEDGGQLHIQTGSKATLTQIEAQMAALKQQYGIAGGSMSHKRGTLCAALFDVGDGSGPQWFRARIEGTARGGDVEVKYIDHGNSATVAGSKLRPLDRCVLVSMQ